MDIKTHLYNSQYKVRKWFIGNYFRRFQLDSSIGVPLDFQPKKVLFVLNGLLGDSVMSVPAIVKARELWNDAHFALLGRSHNCELLAACPLIDEFYENNTDPFSLRKSKDVKKLQKWLEAEKFDLSIVLLGPEYAPLLVKAQIPIRVGVKETVLASCFTHTYEYGIERTWAFTERLDALRALGYRFEDIPPQLWVNDEARASAKQKLRNSGLRENEKYSILHPFGSTGRQWWTMNNIVPFANQLCEKHDFKTVLIGGNDVAPRIGKDINEAVVNTTGQLTVQELLAVIDDSNLVVTTDSGPFHIAGALQKPIVGLFRARRPEHADNFPNTKVVFGRDDSCQSLCEWDYCRSNPCCQMRNISVQEVVDSVDLIL